MTVEQLISEAAKLSPHQRTQFERLWDQTFADEVRTRRLAELRAEIQVGLDQLDRGDYTEITDNTLDEIEAESMNASARPGR